MAATRRKVGQPTEPRADFGELFSSMWYVKTKLFHIAGVVYYEEQTLDAEL